MLTLNLIPQQLKKEIKFKRIYSLFKKMNYILIIITIVIAITLLVAKLMMQNNFNKIVEQTTQVTKNSQSYNVKVRDINSRLNNVWKIQADFIAWSNLIEDLAERTPSDVAMFLININKEDASINLRGRADKRDDLLVLKENMENSAIYSEIEFPLQNLLQKENVNFNINAKLNLDKF